MLRLPQEEQASYPTSIRLTVRPREHCEQYRPSERRRNVAAAPVHTAWSLPSLRCATGAHVRRSGHVPAVRELSGPRPTRRDGVLLPAPRVCLRPVLPCAVAGVRQPRGDLPRVRLLLVVFGYLARS